MSRRHQLAKLRENVPAVLPSLLLCDFGNLEREVARLKEADVRGLHLDVMDGHFVPNLTYGMPVVAALRRITDMPLDVHLMITEPQRYLRGFAEAGADIITFHAEAVDDPRGVLQQIHALGLGAGVAFNPQTSMTCLETCADLCDLVLIMSVEAGFGGQAFQTVALDRLRQVRETVGPDVLLEVDGGINKETVADCTASGAQLLVAGSAIFRAPSYGAAVRELLDLAVC